MFKLLVRKQDFLSIPVSLVFAASLVENFPAFEAALRHSFFLMELDLFGHFPACPCVGPLSLDISASALTWRRSICFDNPIAKILSKLSSDVTVVYPHMQCV